MLSMIEAVFCACIHTSLYDQSKLQNSVQKASVNLQQHFNREEDDLRQKAGLKHLETQNLIQNYSDYLQVRWMSCSSLLFCVFLLLHLWL